METLWRARRSTAKAVPPSASRPSSGRPPTSSAATWTPPSTSTPSSASSSSKYISDAFDRRHAQLLAEEADGADPEHPDEYSAVGAFWVPKAARWEAIQSQAANASIGMTIDAAMEAIERHNVILKDVLPKGYQRPTLNKQQLGELVNLISVITQAELLTRPLAA